ncbi:MAG: hypothetical protein GYB65_20070 [Chloroflexi bacterium]|nr:hypothetical protein [Chloroflexota bacterium]
MNAYDSVYIAGAPQQPIGASVTGTYVTLFDEPFYCIRHYDAMPPFFISVISNSDHWLFISTTGGLTAGRQNAEHALFPYYTVDKITEDHENTGPTSLLLVTRQNRTTLWEPFSNRYRGLYRIERNLYKNIPGTTLIFEEVNHDLALVFCYGWRTSERFGFVKTSWLTNLAPTACRVEVVDGLQNVLPAHVTSLTQNEFSVLLDAYKRSELESSTGLGLFTLSSRLTDLAEPSESLRANTVWQVGLDPLLDNVTHLLSSQQLNAFRSGHGVQPETDIRGRRGAYFVRAAFDLAPDAQRVWHLVSEVDQDSAAVANLIHLLTHEADTVSDQLEHDISVGNQKLTARIGSADGLQISRDGLSTAHHFANVLFNAMRGGIFADQYRIDTTDLRDFVATHQRALVQDQASFFEALPATITVNELKNRAETTGSVDLMRLCVTYLPLTFSRRHGDPSRPWNRFSINIRKADGSQQLDYEGNWRDVFQNWEALAYTYPEFLEGMVSVFLSATTVDGYNPYRITRNGIDWEVPEPSNPWANIGYWGDHQIIYLQKLLEACARFFPGKLETLLTRPVFAFANVPYRIKPYAELVNNPFDTIEFDWDQHRQIEALVEEYGTDGKLVMDADGNVLHTTLAEKLLNLLLAKLVNFVPSGGIWMNTQRPEWNDANNALVGKGISVVTLGYVRRYLVFFKDLLAKSRLETLPLSTEINALLDAIRQVLTEHYTILKSDITGEQRKIVLDKLGQAGSAFREACYKNGLSGETVLVSTEDLIMFLEVAQAIIEHTLRANQRTDKLYHAYNVLQPADDLIAIKHLDQMLEGQVSVVSSGLLAPAEALELLHQLRQSPLYRADQHSYILYPDRDLPGFLAKNVIKAEDVRDLALVEALVEAGDTRLITHDVNGAYHFCGDLRNAQDVKWVLDALATEPAYADLAAAESSKILDVFERVFNHDAFTGRSGSFFAYEGLGSIYWHMVSKLLLAVQETILAVDRVDEETLSALIAAYYDIRAGLGFNKTPDVYGAFPTDPYSHTPGRQGAKQPGMTGMVKEEILTRLGELGLVIEKGQITFDPVLLRADEMLSETSTLQYFKVDGQKSQIAVPANAMAYTFCQVPIILQVADEARIEVELDGDSIHTIIGNELGPDLSSHIFLRDGIARQITVFIRDNLV